MESLGERMKKLREKNELSISEVARKINVSVSTYRDWEYGRKIKGEPYEKIAKVFNTNITFLLTGKTIKAEEELLKIENLVKNTRLLL